ncbi:hypothetical protein OUZ56_012778 [Daphnia magna]|uniref:Peptidase A2 domain-containing protein n=1 Tax=Daphnia magna TaxID=35525 RepID=A0ABQ9Z410_9CRUS|nr:hypothetical protein OUZ56_012778 [Daphnia magna]
MQQKPNVPGPLGPGKRLGTNCSFGSVGRQTSFNGKTRHISHITIIQKSSAPRISLFIDKIQFDALFDTGAARSLLHEKVYRLLPSKMKLASAETDTDLFDVQNRKLQTLGKVKLPVQYGEYILEQEFIITSGISEACILGVDAAFKHEFVLCGRTKTIFLARDKAGRAPLYSSNNLMNSVKKVTTFSLTCRVIRARMSRSQYQLLPGFPFLFRGDWSMPGHRVKRGNTYNLLWHEIWLSFVNNCIIFIGKSGQLFLTKMGHWWAGLAFKPINHHRAHDAITVPYNDHKQSIIQHINRLQ